MKYKIEDVTFAQKVPTVSGNYAIDVQFNDTVNLRFELIPAPQIAEFHLSVSTRRSIDLYSKLEDIDIDYFSLSHPDAREFWLAIVDKAEEIKQQTRADAMAIIHQMLS